MTFGVSLNLFLVISYMFCIVGYLFFPGLPISHSSLAIFLPGDIARNMVVRFGMTSELGQVAFEPETGSFLVGQTPVWRPRITATEPPKQLMQRFEPIARS